MPAPMRSIRTSKHSSTGTSMTPNSGTFHDDNLQLSDIEHQLLHGVGVFENQLDHSATGFAFSKVREPRQAYLLPDPADPHLSAPYRPPRV